jgi:DNA polymerase III epsilon subunit-like protein
MKNKLLRFDNKQKFIDFDTETEGLNLVDSRPWQVAWIVCKGDKIISTHNRFIWWPDLRISPEAARVTRFDINHYKNTNDQTYKVDGKIYQAQSPEEVWKEFEKVFYDPEYRLVGQNIIGFDVFMINVWRSKIGLGPDYSFMRRLIDTRALASAIHQEKTDPPHDLDELILWQYRTVGWRKRGKKVSQLALLKHYDIDFDASMLHDGLYDITKNYEIFRKQIFDIEL